ncbi:unnamed protein product [Rotaria sp. Silwood1]|nr:unnamed protein product [Rotaria sp. Silwood1]
MQTAESVCLWNYQYKNKTSYLVCTKNFLCKNELSSKAIIYCIQCNSLLCILCDNDIHKNLNNKKHERLNLDEIDNEYCSINQQHQAIFLLFNIDQYETKSIKIIPSFNINNENIEPSAYSFEDVQVNNNNDENNLSLLKQKEDSIELLIHQRDRSNSIPKQDNFNQQMLLESMIDDNENIQQNQFNINSSKEFLLFDANEHLTIDDEFEFLNRLKCEKDLHVKCVSIIGNTGDGKSYTLNQIFFNGQEIFHTSSTSNSCTLGIWTAFDENHQIILFDTEGHLGLTENNNRRNRLLFKILCISDIIIYRTRSSTLSNNMFQFLSDVSNVYIKYFQKELEIIMKNYQINQSLSTIGPALIIFHETQHTEILKNYSAVKQIKERFKTMNLSYDAYSSIEYVGIQTVGEKSSDFNEIKATITAILDDNNRRFRRPLSVIFKTLKTLNEKFNHFIPPSLPSTLPDDIFACNIKCLSCRAKCTIVANHEKDNLPHQCNKRCSYNKELDNEVWKCLSCHYDGRDTIVYGKLITKNDGLVQGLLKYVWSGCVIECPYHGEIYRSRKHWYGNNEPKDVTFVEIIHVWPDDDNSRLASDVTPRKFIELIVYASSYLSAPTKLITEMVADQVAPSYWVPNKYVIDCAGCKLHFGSEHSKHHCRVCGHVFCDVCTKYRRIISWIDIEKPVRVCFNCNDNPISPLSNETQKQLLKNIYENNSSNESINTVSSDEQLNDLYLTPTDIFDIEQSGTTIVDIPTSRRVYETVISGLEKIGVNYPIELIKESIRPNYWKPDNECYACHICKRVFNNTTNRLHHCRSCGDGVCENCSPNQRPVPERDWLTPVRMFMYNGYSSYDSEIQRHIVSNSPLSSNVPLSVAEEIVLPYLKYINDLITSNRTFSIVNDKDFKWTLEIFAFGFTCEQPLILQLCSNIYVEWLKVFEGISNNSNSIPQILKEKTEFYWSQMFWHLYHLFVVHDEKPADALTKGIYSHKVLRQLQAVISQTDLSLDLWHILLQVFLAIGDTVLSSPYRTNEEDTAVMSFRLVPSIYQVFLVAAYKVHIPPGLWRTFRDYAVTWRHRPAVVYVLLFYLDWAQLTCVLTSTVVRKLWWPDLISLQYICTETDQSDYIQNVIDSFPLDLLVITWIKFLTILQNPSECGDVSIFLHMPKYLNLLQENSNIKLKDLTSLQELPRIFVNATKAIGMFVDIWLGKDIDLTSLYSPKPMNNSTVTMNDNITSNSNLLSSSRPFTQSVRVPPPPSTLQQQQPATGTLKSTKSNTENRRGNV